MATSAPTGRLTAAIPGDGVVVFLIGMHVNRLRRLRSIRQVATAMPKMLRTLEQDPDLGLLGWRQYRSGRTILLVQYWRSTEDLARFATDPSLPHAPAWRAFNQRVAASGDVGVFHETYRVAAADVEALYSNVPTMGLAAATAAVPITPKSERYRDRIAV